MSHFFTLNYNFIVLVYQGRLRKVKQLTPRRQSPRALKAAIGGRQQLIKESEG